MSKYKIEMMETRYRFQTIEVEADNEHDAEDLAYCHSLDGEWQPRENDHETDINIDSMTELD